MTDEVLIERIDASLGKLKRPDTVILLDKESDDAYFDSYAIHVPVRLTYSQETPPRKFYKTATDSLTIAAHEYGHAVFASNIKLKDLNKLEDWRERKRQESEKAFKSGNYLHNIDDADVPPEFYMVSPYEELFGDVIVVLTSGRNGKAIFNAYFFEEFEKVDPEHYSRDEILPRDFTYSGNSLVAWRQLSQRSLQKKATDPHDFLAPFRYFLWQEYLNSPKVQLTDEQIISALLNAITGECLYWQWILNTDEDPNQGTIPAKLPIIEANEGLIKRFQSEVMKKTYEAEPKPKATYESPSQHGGP